MQDTSHNLAQTKPKLLDQVRVKTLQYRQQTHLQQVKFLHNSDLVHGFGDVATTMINTYMLNKGGVRALIVR